MLADADAAVVGGRPRRDRPRESLRRAGFQAAAAALVAAGRRAVRGARPGAAVGRRRVADAVSRARHPRGDARQRARAGRHAADDRGAAGRQPRAGDRAAADRRRRPLARRRDGAATRPASSACRSPSVAASFKYRVVAGAVTSPTYEVTVAGPPRVTRIDVDYTYPAGLGLPPRTEEDSGDIYAPAGTDVRVPCSPIVRPRPAQMALGGGQPLALTRRPRRPQLSAVADGRRATIPTALRSPIATASAAPATPNTSSACSTIVRPKCASLKPATRSIGDAARRSGHRSAGRRRLRHRAPRSRLLGARRREQVVPLDIPRARGDRQRGTHTLYLEDLDVKPGDFVSYYVRARDLDARHAVERGAQRHLLPRGQAVRAGVRAGAEPGDGCRRQQSGDRRSRHRAEGDHRRHLEARSPRAARRTARKSEQDITVGRPRRSRAEDARRADVELVPRVDDARSAAAARRSAPRRPGRCRRSRRPARPRVPEEDAMTAAAMAMGKAVGSLDALKTDRRAAAGDGGAQPSAEGAGRGQAAADARVSSRARRQRQQPHATTTSRRCSTRSCSGSSRPTTRRRRAPSRRRATRSSVLDKIRSWRGGRTSCCRRSRSWRATRAAVGRGAEARAREADARAVRAAAARRGAGAEDGAPGEPSDSKQQDQQDPEQGGSRISRVSRAAAAQGQSGKPRQSGQSGGGQQAVRPERRQRQADARRLEEMRSAASELRREDPAQASERGSRALEKLRELEQQLQAARARRAASRAGRHAARSAAARRRAASGAVRARRVGAGRGRVATPCGGWPASRSGSPNARRGCRRTLKQQAATAAGPAGSAPGAKARRAEGRRATRSGRRRRGARNRTAAARRAHAAIGRADARAAATRRAGADSRPLAIEPTIRASQAARRSRRSRARSRRLADKLASATGSRDDESQKLSEQLARAQELRERMEEIAAARAGRPMDGGRRQADSRAKRASGSRGRQVSEGNAGTAGQSAAGQQTGGSRVGRPAEKAPGDTGRVRRRSRRAAAPAACDLAQLRDQYRAQLQETRELLDQLRRDDPDVRARRRRRLHASKARDDALGARHRSVQAGLRQVGRAAPAGDAGARTGGVLDRRRSCRPRRRTIGSPPASTTRRRPSISSRSTATSRRWPGRKSHTRRDATPRPTETDGHSCTSLSPALVAGGLSCGRHRRRSLTSYRRPLSPLTRGQRGAARRACAGSSLAALVLFLFRPIAVLPPAEPHDAVVPVLVDVSRSMRVRGCRDGQTAASRRASRLLKTRSLPELSTRFKPEVFASARASPAQVDALRRRRAAHRSHRRARGGARALPRPARRRHRRPVGGDTERIPVRRTRQRRRCRRSADLRDRRRLGRWPARSRSARAHGRRSAARSGDGRPAGVGGEPRIRPRAVSAARAGRRPRARHPPRHARRPTARRSTRSSPSSPDPVNADGLHRRDPAPTPANRSPRTTAAACSSARPVASGACW